MRLALTNISRSVVLISYARSLTRYARRRLRARKNHSKWRNEYCVLSIEFTNPTRKLRLPTKCVRIHYGFYVYTQRTEHASIVLPMHSQRPTYLICAAYFMKPTIVFSAPRRRWVFFSSSSLFLIYKSGSAPHSAYVCRLKFLYLFIQNSNALRFY